MKEAHDSRGSEKREDRSPIEERTTASSSSGTFEQTGAGTHSSRSNTEVNTNDTMTVTSTTASATPAATSAVVVAAAADSNGGRDSPSETSTKTDGRTHSSYHRQQSHQEQLNQHHHQQQNGSNHRELSHDDQHHHYSSNHRHSDSTRISPYDRICQDLANDPRVMKEITLGRRIAFYRIRGEIGTGNFSQVKLGIHVLTKERVAIKILDKTKLDRKTQQWLSREITSMERLHHPNVIRLYEVVETLAKLHIIMEYAGGGELFTKICNEGRLPEDEAKCLFAQLVAAVEHMHNNHIIHRDLKAENVFYASSRWIKVGDFGFSTVARSSEMLNTFCGSPPYAAPELFKDEHYFGTFVDIWALGIILYFMVTGLMPFRAERVSTLKKCILDGSYTVPSYVSDSCVFLIRSILKHIPQDRFTLAEMKRSEWLEGQEFPGPLDAYKLTPSLDNRDINGEEKETRLILENLGIEDSHFRQSSIKDSRSSITGTYRIILHRVQKRCAGLPDAIGTGTGSSIGGNSEGASGTGYDTPDVYNRGAGYSMTAVERRRNRRITPGNATTRSVGSKPQSKTCNIL